MYRFSDKIDVLNAVWKLDTSSEGARPGGRAERQCWPKASAPVDVVFADSGVRQRHVPGQVDFGSRRAQARCAAPNRTLAREIALCRSGGTPRLTILKAKPVADSDTPRACPDCGSAMVPSLLDCALGDNAELAIESVSGHWCWECLSGLIDDEHATFADRLNRWQSGAPTGVAPSFVYDTAAHPRHVQLELTTRCNLTCGYCSNRLLPERRDVDFSRLMQLFDHIDFPMVDQIDLTGLGEALLHPRLADILDEIQKRSAGTVVAMVTNGVSLVPGRVAALLAAGLSRIAVSVDTLDPERFQQQRPGTRLEKVLANLEALVRLRDEQRLERLRLGIHAVITGDPYAEAGPLIEYSARLGLDLPIFTPLDGRQTSHDLYKPDWLKATLSENAFTAFYTWVVKRWCELGGSVAVPSRMKRLHERPLTAARRAEGFHHSALEEYPALWLCKWAVDKCYIASGGAMLTCCNAMTDMPRTGIADLGRAPLREIWTDDLLWAYRLPLALELLPRGCIGCDQAPPQGHPMPT